MPFTLDDVPDLSDQNIIITGASSGIGLCATKMLVSKGAHVVMACRSLEKAQPLADQINTSATSGKASVLHLDTTDLDSIDAFAAKLPTIGVTQLDALILNAGIMMVKYRTIPTRSEKHPEIESQMACNVVGHFYLTHVLTPLILASPAVRIVSVSSAAAEQTKVTDSINYDVFFGAKPESYGQVSSYCESKLGNLLLMRELSRRLSVAKVDATAVSAHPGYSRTALQERAEGFILRLLIRLTSFLAMPAEGGGLVLVRAATMPDAELPELPYFGPDGLMGWAGAPTADIKMVKQGRNDAQALRLWEACEELCAVKTAI